MKRKILWKVLLIIGISILAVPLILGLYASIIGTSSGICLIDCEQIFGLDAFIDFIYFYSYIFWPSYILSVVLIIISIIKLKNK